MIMSEKTGDSVITINRKARYDYDILETYEAGIVLVGTEVKSLRLGKVNLKDSYGVIRDGECFLMGVSIAEYAFGNRFNHEEKRPRKLLLHRLELTRLFTKIKQDGLTLVPLKLYWKRGCVKVELGLARGKKLFDKRQKLKDKEVTRRLNKAY